MASCTECNEKVANYKCPKCYARYCSVACCKSHKAKECDKQKKPDDSINQCKDDAKSRGPQWGVETESEDYVHPDKLAKLGDSVQIKGLLQNRHLRAILENLVNTGDPAKDMEAAMMEPIFVQLADQCLKVVEGEGQGEGNVSD